MRIFTLFVLVVSFSANATSQQPHQVVTLPTIQLTDQTYTLLLSSDVRLEDAIQFANIFSQSAGYALMSDQVINGSGTNYLLDPTQKEGYFTRMLNVLSFYDLYFTSNVHRFSKERMRSGEKKSFSALLVPLASSYVTELPAYEESHALLMDAPRALLPVLGLPSVRKVPESAYVLEEGSPEYKNTVFSMRVRQSLANYYDELVQKAKVGQANRVQRLASLFALYLPMASEFHMYVEKKDEDQFIAKSKLDLFFPAIGQVKGLQEKDYAFWEIEGLHYKFKTEIVTDFAAMEGYSYSSSQSRDRFPLLKVSVMKDYNNIHEKELLFTFGVQGGSESGELISINQGELSDQLQVFGRIHIKALEENVMFKLLPKQKKKAILDYINEFKVDLGIHKLALRLTRDTSADDFEESFSENKTFKVHFEPNKSHFTYNIRKQVRPNTGLDKKWTVHEHLERLDFTCDLVLSDTVGSPEETYNCARYFKDSKSFQDTIAQIIFNELARKALNEKIPVMQGMADKDINKMLEELVSKVQFTKEAIQNVLMNSR